MSARSVGRRYASINEAAEYYRVHHKFIRGLIQVGTLPGYQIHGTKLIRVDLNELDDLAANQKLPVRR